MRTTVTIDEKLLKQVEEYLGESSPSKAVNAALREFVRRRKLEELRQMLGTMDLDDNWRELKELELEDMRKNEW